MKILATRAIVDLMKSKYSIFIATLLLVPVLFTGGCASEPPASTLPEIGFSHLKKINLKASTIEIASEYKSSLQAPFVEHRFSTSPEKAAINWAKTRLVASVNANKNDLGKARFIITEASVKEVPVEKKKTGIVGIFTAEPTANYFAKLEAKLIIEPSSNKAGGEIDISATRNILIHEDVSLAERERIWLEMVEALMVDFNNEMENRIRTHFSRFIE